MYLCGASLSSLRPPRGPARRGSRRVWPWNRRGKVKGGEGGKKDGSPVTRKPHEGKKSSISTAKCAPGRCKGGRGRARESRRKTKGYELTILVQGCRFTAAEQPESSAMLISPANLNKLQPCFNHSHPLVAHPLGAKVAAAVLFLFQLPQDKYFPPARQSSSMGKSPHAGQNIHTLLNPMRLFPPPSSSEKKPVLRICQHF